MKKESVIVKEQAKKEFPENLELLERTKRLKKRIQKMLIKEVQ